MEASPQLADEHEVRTAVAADKRPLSSDRNKEEEDDQDGANIEKENTGMCRRAGLIQDASGAAAAAAADNTESVVLKPLPAHGIVARQDTEADFHPLEAKMVMEMHEGVGSAGTSDEDAQQPSDVPIVSAEDPQAAAPNFAVPDAVTFIDSNGTRSAATVYLTPSIVSTAHVAKGSPVQSYLAWLFRRRTCFPIASLNQTTQSAWRSWESLGYQWDTYTMRSCIVGVSKQTASGVTGTSRIACRCWAKILVAGSLAVIYAQAPNASCT
jgi:hypothetical protein